MLISPTFRHIVAIIFVVQNISRAVFDGGGFQVSEVAVGFDAVVVGVSDLLNICPSAAIRLPSERDVLHEAGIGSRGDIAIGGGLGIRGAVDSRGSFYFLWL